MISIVRLSESGKKKFNTWFASVGREGVLAGAVDADLCDIMLDRLAAKESLVYELEQRYTNTGRPELLTLDRSDLDVEDTEPTTREEIEVMLKAKIEANEAETGLYDTGLRFVVVDRVNGELIFQWFDCPMQLTDVLFD